MTSSVEISLPPLPAEAFERFPGCWVVLRDEEIVAVGQTLEDLKSNYDVADGDTFFRVPERHSKFL